MCHQKLRKSGYEFQTLSHRRLSGNQDHFHPIRKWPLTIDKLSECHDKIANGRIILVRGGLMHRSAPKPCLCQNCTVPKFQSLLQLSPPPAVPVVPQAFKMVKSTPKTTNECQGIMLIFGCVQSTSPERWQLFSTVDKPERRWSSSSS